MKGIALVACALLAAAGAIVAGAAPAWATDALPLRARAITGSPSSSEPSPSDPSDPDYRLLVLGGQTVRWRVPAGGLAAKITYAFLAAPASFPGSRNCDAMLPPQAALAPSRIDAADFRREVRAAFSTWEAVANITFAEVAPDAGADILIGADAKARGRAFTNVALADGSTRPAHTTGGMGTIRQSLICLNPERPWKIGFDGDLEVYDLRFTLTHEIGHAIGLDHPGPDGELMSFRYTERARGLQAGDIAGAVALYGRKGAVPVQADAVAAKAASAMASMPAFGLGVGAAGR